MKVVASKEGVVLRDAAARQFRFALHCAVGGDLRRKSLSDFARVDVVPADGDGVTTGDVAVVPDGESSARRHD